MSSETKEIMGLGNIFSGKKRLFIVLLYLSDLIMLLLSFFISLSLVYAGMPLIPHLADASLRIAMASLIILTLNYLAYGLYKNKRNLFDDIELMSIFYSCVTTLASALAFIYLFQADFPLLWLAASLSFLLCFILTSSARFMLYQIILRFRKAGFDQKRVGIFGPNAKELAEKIAENEVLGYKVTLVTDSLKKLQSSLDSLDTVFITKERIDDQLLAILISDSKVNWKIIPSAANLIMDPVTFDEFKDYPIINVSGHNGAASYAPVKRAMDILLSGIALTILSPLLLVVATAIKLSSPGPVFFIQERLGKNLKPFRLYKFRSMIANADSLKEKLERNNEVKGLFKIKDDPRITTVGKFIRKTNIDELPQLINIFKADMSIVGPRPHLERELPNFKQWRRARFSAKPGLTGLWQVNGRHELNFDKAVLFDIYYIKHMSLAMDISIILRTIPSILFSRGRH